MGPTFTFFAFGLATCTVLNYRHIKTVNKVYVNSEEYEYDEYANKAIKQYNLIDDENGPQKV